MKRECREVRRRWGASPVPASDADHLARCEDCSRLAGRLAVARRLLCDHHATFEPDPRFASRVTARLPSPAEAAWRWAVARVLPATVALALVLVWFSWTTRVAPTHDEPSPTDDVLAWVIDQAGAER